MKKIIQTLTLLTAAFFFALNMQAQTLGKQLTGTVSEKEGLTNVTVVLNSLEKETKSSSTVTDVKGAFIFTNLKAGFYKLNVTHVGYKTYSIDSIKIGDENKTLTIKLTPSVNDLNEVTVSSAMQPFIKQTAGKTIITVASSPIAAGGNAYDVLVKSPGVRENNSNIQLRGKGVNVLIDGRQTFLTGEELKNYLSAMPANTIDKIELISNPSAKYDAQGAAVINITTTKMRKFGTNGVATLGVGAGVYGRYNGGISLNYRTPKMNLYGSYDYMHTQQYLTATTSRKTNNDSTINEFTDAVTTRNNNSLKVGLDYDLNKKNSVGVLVKGLISNKNDQSATESNVISNTTGNNISSTVNKNGESKLTTPSVNVYYKSVLDSTGKELKINADYYSYDKQTNDNFTTRYFNDQKQEYINPTYLNNNSPAKNNIVSIAADYTNPTKIGNFEAGLKTTFTKTDNDAFWQQQVNGNWQVDPTKTNHFIYKENINAGYINYSRTFKKLDLQAGVRMEQTNTEGYSITLDQINKNNYFNIFPNVALQYNLSAKHQFGISYRKSIERFGFDIVNPFTIYKSQYSYYQGNPSIQPSFAHGLELNYSYNNMLFTTFSYTHYLNVLSDVFRLDSTTNAVVNSFANLNTADNWEADITFSKKFFKVWTNNTTVSLVYAKYNSSAYQQMTNAKLAYMANSSNIFQITKQLKAEVNLSYMSPLTLGVYTIQGYFRADAGITKTVLKNKGALTLNVSDIFNSAVSKLNINSADVQSYNVTKVESRFVKLVFSYRFGNNNVAASKNRRTSIDDVKSRMGGN